MSHENPSTRTLSRRGMLVAAGLAGASGLAACTIGRESSPPGPSGPPPKAAVTITSPVPGATDVPASAEIVFTAKDAVSTSVVLKDASGATVAGDMHPDGSGWMPERSLAFGREYTATVTATGDDGRPATVTSSFTIMDRPAKTVGFSSFLADGAVVGVGMPMIIRISRGVDPADRAAIQRRLLVRTDPVQEGIWTWYSASELHWRPREFWRPDTKVVVTARTRGLPVGGGYFGGADLTLDCTVGRSVVMTIDDKASPKVMKVVRDGVLVREIPVSLGRPSMPSSSGTTVIIERLVKTIFDTRDDPNPANRYRMPIDYAQRLTWGGEFIHSAPWSVADQGKRNVSHGCVNMSPADAKWLFEQTHIGDPVTITGTSRPLQWNNGWTDWDRPWQEYVKGSAIPYESPPDAGTVSPSPTG